MRKLRIIISLAFTAALIFILNVAVGFADASSDGWSVDSDGAIRYYREGNYLVGDQSIGEYSYSFASDGKYLGVYDSHVNVGKADISLDAAYEPALKQFVAGGGKVYAYHTFDQNKEYTDTAFRSSVPANGVFSGTRFYSKVDGIYISTDKYNALTVQRDTKFEMAERGDGSALHVISSKTTEGTHSYYDVLMNGHTPGNDIVIEVDYKLGEGYNYKSGIFTVIDRKNLDTNADTMPSLLTLNSDGGVYINSKTDALIAVLTEREYTRFSIAIHPATNTMDVYVNGLLVANEAKFLTDAKFNSMNFQVEALRGAQFTGKDLGSLYVDNFAAYNASAPLCTVSEEARNGVYLEGEVLRCYRNDLIAVGNNTVTGDFGGFTFDGERLYFGSINGSGAYFFGNKAKITANGGVISENNVAGNLFIAPEPIELDNGIFSGWRITDGSDTVYLAPGDVYAMNGDIICEAYGLDFSMTDGASIRTTAGSTGIRFMAKIKSLEYDTLQNTGVQIEPHMLIVPTEYMDKLYGYSTLEAFAAAGFTDMIDITATEWYRTGAGYYYYVGSVANILPENFMIEYSGVAYLKLTYPNGDVRYGYASYDREANSRSVYRVAHAAYNDRKSVGDPDYAYSVSHNGTVTYSPYNEERLTVIKDFADRVIMLKTRTDGINTAGDFYNAPYSITKKFNSVTKKTDVTITPIGEWSISAAEGVVLDGTPITDYTVTDKCQFSVVPAGTSLVDLSLDTSSTSWMLMDASDDYTKFPRGQLNTNPSFCYENGADSVKWEVKNGWEFVATPSKGATIGKYTAKLDTARNAYYYDLTDMKSISFAIYSVMDNQSLQFNFHSENPSNDGIDYYGKMLKLKQGWNFFVLNKNSFGTYRTPLGWDKISKVSATGSGWDQVNSKSNVLYFTDIVACDSVTASTHFRTEVLKDAAVFAVGGHYFGVNGHKYRASDTDANAVAFEKDGVYYLPVGVGVEKGMTGKYFPSTGELHATYKSMRYVFSKGSRSYTVNGVKKTLAYAAEASGDALCLSANDVMSLFGYSQLYVDRMGLIVLSNTPDIYDHDEDYNTIYSLIEECIYVRPTGEQIVSDLNSNSGGQHPYLMVDGEGFERLRYYARMDATMQAYIKKLEGSYGVGTSKFNAAVNVYKITDGRRLLSISRDVMNKTITWALLAKLYEVSNPSLSVQYAERCWKEIESACNFKDENGLYSWHPDHFLDTAELAYPVAICYDWLYDYWADTDANVDTEKYGYAAGATRRQIMEDAMYWMALSVSSVLPSDTTGKYITYNYNISGSTNNWNGVCNGGLMAAALAICNVERYKENVEKYIGAAITAIEKGMWVYAPDGGYEEGPGYWSYGTTYTQVFISCLDSACGTNYGIYNAPGFGHSVYFTTYMGTKNTTWGFHDGGSGSADTNIASWFAKKDNDPNVNAIRRQAIANGWKGVSMYDLMYFDPHVMTSTITLGLDAYYSLDDIMTFRSSWEAGNNVFTGLHGGDNAASHGDLDIGNFVINVDGTFIIGDLGGDAYNIAGYFGNYRWSYYRKRAEGQNTLVMIPSRTNTDGNGWNGKTGIPCIVDEKANKDGKTDLPTPDQIKSAISKVLRYESKPEGAIGIVDMSTAYTEMTEGRRGLWFTDDRSTIIIQDEARFSEAMDIWWFAHTEGNIAISEDGRSAVITRNGICLYAEIITDMTADVRFSKMAAVSLDKDYVGDSTDSVYYTDDTEKSRSNISKLCVTVDDVTELKLAVAFKVIDTANDMPLTDTVYSWKSMDDWQID